MGDDINSSSFIHFYFLMPDCPPGGFSAAVTATVALTPICLRSSPQPCLYFVDAPPFSLFLFRVPYPYP